MERQYDHEQQQDAPLREEDVTAGDRLDDRVSEGDGLAAGGEFTTTQDDERRKVGEGR